jgi:hypothetical protein
MQIIIEIPSYFSHNGCHQENRQQQMLVKMPGKMNPYT